jgi:hypothetical protein
VNKEMYIDILHHLVDAVRQKSPKKEEPTFGFSFMTMLQHIGQGFLSKEQCENSEASPYSPELAPVEF